tara:strand:- start:2032 stop:2682 length:651 start_codon:yes stop_codon:yes gene_type:complete
MSKNLKKRIATSIGLIFLLFGMFFSNFILAYFIIVMGTISTIEYLNINSIIYKKKKLLKYFLNFLFLVFLFFFCLLFILLSTYNHYKIFIFIILLICIFSDIGGFTIGKIFKGKKLTKISPKKTISGAIGSLLFSSTLSLIIFYYLTEEFSYRALILGLVTSIACQLGDLFFSLIKRKSFLKDTGNFLPGHGGILDRVDSILLGLPIGFLTLILFY